MNKESSIVKKLAQLARNEILAGTESYEAFIVHYLYRNGLISSQGGMTIDTGTTNYAVSEQDHHRVCSELTQLGILRRRTDRNAVYFKLSLQFRSMVNFHKLEDDPIDDPKFDFECVQNRELAVLIRTTLLSDSTDDIELSICRTLYQRAPYPITTSHPRSISSVKEALISAEKVVVDEALVKAVNGLQRRGVIVVQIYAGREYYYLSLEMMTLMSHIYGD
jgi:hypothetical protein